MPDCCSTTEPCGTTPIQHVVPTVTVSAFAGTTPVLTDCNPAPVLTELCEEPDL